MAVLRTIAEIEAAGLADGAQMPPLTQAEADHVAVLLAPWLPRLAAAPQPARMKQAQAASYAA